MNPPNKPPNNQLPPGDEPPALPPARSFPLPPELKLLMAELSEAQQRRLLDAIGKISAETSDPYFTLLFCHATIAKAIVEAPEKIEAAFEQGSQKMLVQTDRYLAKIRETAVKENQAAIAQSVERLLTFSREQQAFISWKPIALWGAIAISGLLAVGGWSGYMLSQYQRGPMVAGEKVHLTQAEADGLQWLKSSEGQLAKNLVYWNNGQIAACQQQQVNLFKSEKLVVAGYGEVESGACALWVVPTGARRFSK